MSSSYAAFTPVASPLQPKNNQGYLHINPEHLASFAAAWEKGKEMQIPHKLVFQPHYGRFSLSTAWQAIPARQLGVCLSVWSFSTTARAQYLEDCLKFWSDNGSCSLTPQILRVSFCGGWDRAFLEVTPQLLTRHPQGLLALTELTYFQSQWKTGCFRFDFSTSPTSCLVAAHTGWEMSSRTSRQGILTHAPFCFRGENKSCMLLKFPSELLAGIQIAW